jgi:peptidyl-prolyl cis-trans isomerase SurA
VCATSRISVHCVTPVLSVISALLLTSAAMLLGFLAACDSHLNNHVLVTVDGRKIVRSELDKYYDSVSVEQTPTSDEVVALKLNILSQMIDDEIMMNRAEKLGILATDEEVDRKFNEYKAPMTQEELEQRLKDKKMTLADFKRDIRRSITFEKLINRDVSSKIAVTDQNITDYYKAHMGEFNLIEPKYHLAQIMVTPEASPQAPSQNDKALNKAEARKKIDMIINRLDIGEDFGALAMRYSEDPATSGNGGDLGMVPESGLKATDPLTRAAILKLRPGQYSPIISIINPANRELLGFRIVKLISKEPAGQRELSDPRVQQAIRSQLHDRREQLLKTAYHEVLRDSSKVENYYAKMILDNNGIDR